MALGEETWRREASWTATFNEIKASHDLAYRKIDEALKFDEEGQRDKALRSYDEGLLLLDKALAMNIECPPNPDFTWEKACSMVDKMRKTRKEILSRIADAQVLRPREPGPPVIVNPRPDELTLEPPPSYDEAMATSPSSSSGSNIPSLPQSTATPTPTVPLTYSELGDALRNLKVETNTQSVQVVFSVDDVRMYFISPNGQVSAPSQPTQLRVLALEAEALNHLSNGNLRIHGQNSDLPQFFLQVEDWFYPLVPGVSPCFRSDYGAFILPNLLSNIEGSAVGLILPAEADISLYNLLEDVLGGGVMSSPPAAPPRNKRDNFSTTISRGLVTGAHFVSKGMVKGAEAASSLMSSTTPKIISRIQPEATARPVPPTLRTGAKVARTVTHTAVNVTGYVAGKVGTATLALGRYLAPHIQRGGTKLLSRVGVGEQAAADGVGGVLTVAAGAVEGFGTIYTGLEQSAGILGTSLTDNTVQIVHHKYGEPMAEVTGNTLFTVGNVINTTNNIQNLTPKGLAKRTAKNAGRAIVEPHIVHLQDAQPSTSGRALVEPNAQPFTYGRALVEPNAQPFTYGRALVEPNSQSFTYGQALVEPNAQSFTSGQALVEPNSQSFTSGRALVEPNAQSFTSGQALVEPNAQSFTSGQALVEPNAQSFTSGQALVEPNAQSFTSGQALVEPNSQSFTYGRALVEPNAQPFTSGRALVEPNSQSFTYGQALVEPNAQSFTSGQALVEPNLVANTQMTPSTSSQEKKEPL